MGLFSRKKKDAEELAEEPTVVAGDDSEDTERHDSQSGESTAGAKDGAAAGQDSDGGADSAGDPEPEPAEEVSRDAGPFDRTEVDDLDGRLDFGAIAIVPVLGMELRLDLDDEGQEITGLTAIHGESACQMQAFAAPRSRGIWREVRHEIHDNLVAGGGQAEERTGPLGTQLHVRMPAQGPDGRTTYSPATFVGVDGPRWFLRAVLSGAAAMSEEGEAEMISFIQGVVVTRGKEARAPREMLPLKVPADAQPGEPLDEGDTPSIDPFERGPEITEVR